MKMMFLKWLSSNRTTNNMFVKKTSKTSSPICLVFFQMMVLTPNDSMRLLKIFQASSRVHGPKRIRQSPKRKGKDNFDSGPEPLHHLHAVQRADENITAFWKTMISFIAPEATPFVNKIHVSYTGCVREAQRRCDTTQTKHIEMFRDYLYFSVAGDMAQFGQDHFLSCIG